MLKLLLVLFLLVSTCVAIHGVGMIFGIRWPRNLWARMNGEITLPQLFWLTASRSRRDTKVGS